MAAETPADEVRQAICSEPDCEREQGARGLCRMHYSRARRAGQIMLLPVPSPTERFAGKYCVTKSGCWSWATFVDEDGYGWFKIGGRNMRAHRAAYALFIGPIPEGMELDHRCHTEDLSCPGGPTCLHRRCVNPAHLEPVTGLENIFRGRGLAAMNARKTHCPQNHAYDEENTLLDREGKRYCRACKRAAGIRYNTRKKAAA